MHVLVSDESLMSLIIYIGINCLMNHLYSIYTIITCNNVSSYDVGVWQSIRERILLTPTLNNVWVFNLFNYTPPLFDV